MQSRADWSQWVETLRRFKVDGLTSWLLEAGSPLAVIGAQALYVTEPFVGGKTLKAVAQMLEEESELQAFLHTLRGERA
jgi:hypothetical protein